MRRGVTLVEMLMGMALMGMIISVLNSLLVPGLGVWMRGSARAELQQDGVMTTNWLTKEFTASCSDSVIIVPGTYVDPQTHAVEERDMLSFYSPYDANDNVTYSIPLGQLQWQNQILYYLDPVHNTIVRQVHPIAPTIDPTRPPTPVMSTAELTHIISRSALSLTFIPVNHLTTDQRLVPASIKMVVVFRSPTGTYTAEAGISALFNND